MLIFMSIAGSSSSHSGEVAQWRGRDPAFVKMHTMIEIT
jgi:hypothetical protein